MAIAAALALSIMATMDLPGSPEIPPSPPPRRRLTAVVAVAGFLICIPIFTIAAVAGFTQGWRSAPRVLPGENIVQPLIHLGSTLAGAALYTVSAMAAVASVAVVTILIRHRIHRTGPLPTSRESDHAS